MSSRNRTQSSAQACAGAPVCTSLTSSDRLVLTYLNEQALAANSEYCTASIPRIARACNISPRQVQISTGRLIGAGLLKRVGYDFSNSDRTRRGTVYKVITNECGAATETNSTEQKKTIKFFLFWSEDY
jgi:hypothetical protein